MYEDLVKRLRDSEHEIDCSLCDRDCCYPDGKVHGECIIIEAADAIEVLSKMEKTTQWIPVTEGLPMRFKSVLAVDKYGVITINWISGDGKNWSTGYYITHWMPLPKPPKEDV